MKSDVIVKQFVDRTGNLKIDHELQEYLNGNNEWDSLIMESDIIQVHYAFNTSHSEENRRRTNVSAVLIMHRIPE